MPLWGIFNRYTHPKPNGDKYFEFSGRPYGISWFSTILTIVLLVVGLWNAELTRSEKGFYAISFVLSIFAAIAVQKNTRDMKLSKRDEG